MKPGGLRIGELAKATDTKIVTIRYYERIGLLPEPVRTKGNYRTYAWWHVEQLSFIRRTRNLGFSLEETRALLRLADDRGRSCVEVERIARRQLGQVERRIADLKKLSEELRQMIDRCGSNTIAECRILEALAPALSQCEHPGSPQLDLPP
jgi:Cu(I)-responsive transcriptional regulator